MEAPLFTSAEPRSTQARAYLRGEVDRFRKHPQGSRTVNTGGVASIIQGVPNKCAY